MGTTKRRWDPRGLSLPEVLIGGAILVVGLLGALGAVSTSYLDLDASAGLSKATAYAHQEVETLKNQPFTPGPLTGTDSLEGGLFVRTWRIEPIAGPVAPNRLARIVVTVNWTGGRPQTVTLETMRAE